MNYKGYNVLTLKTSNEEIHHIQLALGIDLGTCRFATIATTEGNVEIIGSEPLNHYCKLIDEGESTEASMNMWLLKKVKALVEDWYDRGVEAVYVGCCKGDYLTLCGGDENHPFYKHKVFETFIKYLEAFCQEYDIPIETVDFDESYTSRANSLNGDYIPNHGDTNIPHFIGKRELGIYVIDKHMVMNADVNAAINILHKAGFSVRVSVGSNVVDYITIVDDAS